MDNAIEKTFSLLSIKRQWHQLFDFAPICSKLSVYEDAKDIFEPFLKWAEKNAVSMDWSLHLYLLRWLCEHEKWCVYVDDKIKKELLIATATRWLQSGIDHIHAKGLILTSRHFPDKGVAIWKSKKAEEMARVVVLSLSTPLYPKKDAYALIDTYEQWHRCIQWQDW